MANLHKCTDKPTLRRFSIRVLPALLLFLVVNIDIAYSQTGIQLGRPTIGPAPAPKLGTPIIQAAYLQQPNTNKKKRNTLSVNIVSGRERLLPGDVPKPDPIANQIRTGLQTGSDDQKVALASLLAEAGSMSRTERNRANYPKLWMTQFGPELLAILGATSDPLLTRKALEAYSQLQADPVSTAKTLSEHASPSAPIEVRLAAARGLTELAEVIDYLASNPPAFRNSDLTTDENERKRRAQEEIEREKWWNTFQEGRIVVLDAALNQLTGTDIRVHREAIKTIDTLADGLVERTNTALPTDRLLGKSESRAQRRRRYRPLLLAFQRVTPALASTATVASDVRVRLQALRALEKIGQSSQSLADPKKGTRGTAEPIGVTAPVAQTPTAPPWRKIENPVTFLQPEPVPPPGAANPLKAGLQANLDTLTQWLQDSDVRVRRSAVDVFEAMGDTAEPAIPALIQATRDSDSFVRWAAARTLGRLQPRQAETVVPALAQLLSERDIDVRIATAKALERYGEKAELAVPSLTASIQQGDAPYRIAGLAALKAIGDSAAPSVPAIAGNLVHPNYRVRQSAAETLGSFGSMAQAAVPALRRALLDRNNDVRRAANNALLAITTDTPK